MFLLSFRNILIIHDLIIPTSPFPFYLSIVYLFFTTTFLFLSISFTTAFLFFVICVPFINSYFHFPCLLCTIPFCGNYFLFLCPLCTFLLLSFSLCIVYLFTTYFFVHCVPFLLHSTFFFFVHCVPFLLLFFFFVHFVSFLQLSPSLSSVYLS